MSFLAAGGSFENEAVTAALLAFVTVVAVSDLVTHRIPNTLTMSGAALGLALNGLQSGGGGLLHGALGLLVGLGVFLPLFFLARGFAAGDVKAMAAVGAYLGPQGALLAACWTLIAGMIGVLTLFAVSAPTALAPMLRRWTLRACVLCTSGARARIDAPPRDAARRRLPYGLAIACGTVIVLVWS